MQIFHGLGALASLSPGAVVSIGNFDGVHLGHHKILQTARKIADSRQLVVITFEPHPMTVLRPGKAPPRLTLPEMKQELIAAAGVDAMLILEPTAELLSISAESFWQLLRDAQIAHLVEGPTFNFGKGRRGNIQTLREWAGRDSVGLTVVEPVEVALLDLTLVQISSSIVRWLVSNGRMRDAAICLGRPYSLRGQVIEGFKRGRTIGVPTANMNCGEQLVPADGVYSGRCVVNAKTYAAAISIGTLPTFNEVKRQVEAHLIGFNGDLYGRQLDLEVTDWIRDQIKFASVEALKERMDIDIQFAREGVR
jgi:riboflavin kinase/FMN adenylyltransferase